MSDNLARFHAAIADLPPEMGDRVRQHVFGYVADDVPPEVWDAAIESALTYEVRR